MARPEIPQPSPELGFTAAVMETAPPGSVGAWGMTVLRKASWCSAGGREQGTPRLGGWLDRPPPTPTAPCPRHPPLLPGGDIQEKSHLAEGKLRHGGLCLSPLQRSSAEAGTWQLWDSQPQPVPGLQGLAAPGRALPALGFWRACTASAGRGSAHGSKDIPAPARAPRAGGIGCPQLRAAFHLLPGRGSLSITCCPPGRRPREPRAGPMCETWLLCPHVLWPDRGVARCPRWAMGAGAACHSTHPTHPMHPTQPTPSSSAQGGLSWDGAW